MIVYAFYTSGKTYACKNNEDYCDFDFQMFYFKNQNKCFYDLQNIENEYRKKAKELENKYSIVFINHYVKDTADYAIFPENFHMCIERINERKQGNFVPDIEEYNGLIELFSEETEVIFLKDGLITKDYLNETRVPAAELEDL